jgi:hypothetical protein
LWIGSLLAHTNQAGVVRQKWWRVLVVAGTISTVGVIAMSRQRPFWPAMTVTNYLVNRFPGKEAFVKLRNAFSWCPSMTEVHCFLQRNVPENERYVGYAANSGAFELSLWKPLWKKRVFRVTKFDTWQTLHDRGIRYVFLDISAFRPPRYDMLGRNWGSVEQWMREIPSRIVASTEMRLDPQMPPTRCYVVKLEEKPPRNSDTELRSQTQN